MSMTKKNIALKISQASNITYKESEMILNSFLEVIKKNSIRKTIKIGNFGSFFYKQTPERIGRNPATQKEHKIKSFQRLIFRSSFRLKKFLN